MLEGTCPECGAVNDMYPDDYVGNKIDCEECGNELEIVCMDPVTLELWDDDSDF